MTTNASNKKYTKKDQISHVLLRPEMYIGSTSLRNSDEYIAIKDDDGYKIINKNIQSSPAILRIFIEILSNAIDNYQRSVASNIPSSYIKISIDRETGETVVSNDGDFIPIEMNEEENMYNHSLIFGHLLAGSNFDDSQERLVSGMNGVGATACNIFSKRFTVKGLDPNVGKTFEQTWENNMKDVTKPIIKNTKLKKSYTEISYVPDFERFGVKGYTDDIYNQYMKYVLDTAVLTKVKVYFNEELIPVNNLLTYANLFESPTDEKMHIKDGVTEVVVTTSTEFESVTFVNGIFTKLGGTHLDAWSEAIFRPILNKLNGKKDKPALSIKDVKQVFRVFITTTVNNPRFESQSKNKLEFPKVVANVKSADINKIWKWSVISDLQDIIKSKEMLVLKKSEKKKKGYTKIDGYDPANYSGTKNSHLCSLILCEGLSAKTYAVAGIEKGIYGYEGRNYFGVLSLTGKILNCRNSNLQVISKNKVITNLIQALGLQYSVDYTNDDNFKTLSYGRVVLLTDSDVDGLHISGLIMNFFHFLFPSLLKRSQPFLVSMITPIVRVFNKGGDILFYDENRFKEFVRNQTKSFKSKYYKGLGTTKTEDIPDTFGEKMVEYCEDIKTDKSINKVFHKDFADDRKKWLECFNPNPEFSIDDGGKMITMNMSSFLDNEVIKFSHDDCKRSIPSLFDGLKQSQRKILFAMKKRNLTYNKQSVKVAQLGGYVAEHTNYHHGEQNLYQTMVKMAHEFPGSNNIPLLYRDGQFGCLDPETDILMWNGTKKKAKNIQIGDRLIGDDGYPRNVKQITTGEDDMYNIIQFSGQTYKVNSQHILTLYCESHKNIWWSDCSNSWNVCYYDKNESKLVDISIPVKIFSHTTGFTKEKGYKHISDLIKDIPCNNNTFDVKVADYLQMTPRMQSKFKGIFCNTHIKWKSSKTSIDAYELGILLRNRRNNIIPFSYIYNDMNTRKKLLHGFFNSSSSIDTFKDSYEIDEKYSYLFDRIKIICNSLGFHTNQTSTSLTINTKPVYFNKIEVEYAGKGEFYGWSVDGNERFLLGDYTVTHNSRLSGGDDAASPRYIYTKMETLTPLLFREEDDVLLEYIEDDGDKLEPTFYVPILPMILINGCNAIGTGWSSNIPCYNPHDIINCIKTWLEHDGNIFIEDDEDPGMILSLLPSIIPWYRGFYGKIEEKDNKYITYGIISKEKNKTKITELPIGMWTDKFKEFCEDLLVDKQLKSLNNESTPQKVHFTLVEHDEGISCNHTNMKLTSTINISNMVAFNEKNQLKKYSVDEIINDFCIIRFALYKKRKLHLINHCEKELRHLGNKARFIKEVIDKKLNIMNIDEDIIIRDLEKRKYDKEFKNDDDNDTTTASGYEYLLRMPVRVLSANQINKLKNDINSIQTKLDIITSISEKKMWLNDIDEFEIEYDKWLKNMKNISDKNIRKKK